jgi:ABC-type glycerol-3-phosphate transport system substrate-binding protein
MAACGGDDDAAESPEEPSTTTATIEPDTGAEGSTETTVAEGSDEGESGTTPTEPAAVNDVDGELVVWTYATGDAQIAIQDDMIELFNAAYPNVEVTFEFQPYEEMTQKLLTTAASQQGPDVILYNWGDAYKLADADVIQPMDEWWDSWPEKELVPESVQHPIDGELYSVQPYVNLIALYYNKSILEEAGVEPPATVDEFEAAMAAATEIGAEGYVGDFGPAVSGWWAGMPWMWGACLDMEMNDQARLEAAMARVRSWVDEGYMSPDVVTLSQTEAMTKFLGGDVAFTVNGNWLLADAEASGVDFGVVKIPDGECPAAVYLGGEGMSIGQFSENPDLAFEFITHTYFSKEGGVRLINKLGSLAARLDTADEPVISENPALAVFSQQIATGRALPDGAEENAAQTFFGDTFSAVVAGQTSPADAAAEIVAKTPGLLAGG